MQRALGQFPFLPTNRNLKALLGSHMGVSFSDTYATNAFAFVRSGKMDAHIPFPDLVRSAAAYALPQIAIVRPKMVLCLGSASFNAVRRAIIDERSGVFGKRDRKWMPLASAWCIEDPFHTEHFGIPVFGVAHPGANGHARKRRASGDYAKVAGILPLDPAMRAFPLSPGVRGLLGSTQVGGGESQAHRGSSRIQHVRAPCPRWW